MSFSENAIMTRARAMYAKRLTAQNYKELINCNSIAQAADYLSTKTQYFDDSIQFTSAKLNRMMLESLLKRNFIGQFSSLYKFSKIIGNKMCRYFVMLNEITVIMSCLRYVLAPNKLDIFISTPTFDDMSVGFDIMGLARSENFKQMLAKLEDTEYYDVLKPFENEKTDVLKIENALYGFLDKRICQIAKKSLQKKEYDEVYEVLAINSDLNFISKVLRLKEVYNFPPEKIKDYGFSLNTTLFQKKETEKMIAAKDAEEFLKAVGETVYGKGETFQKVEDIEDVTNWARQYEYNIYSKKIMYSTCPNTVMMCCFFLKKNEVKNITNIIEGIKYGLEPNEIEKNLVGCES